MKTKGMYCFSVKCEYLYEISAHNEETARKILQDKGGLDISGELLLSDDDYKRAELLKVTKFTDSGCQTWLLEEKK